MPSNQSTYGLGIVGEEFDLPLPSGNTARVRKLGPEQLIQAGLLDKVDALTAMVNELHIARVTKGAPGKAIQDAEQTKTIIELIKDQSRWKILTETIDGALPYAVVAPEVRPYPAAGAEREPGAIYPDMVALMDRITIFTAAIQDIMKGQEAMAPFRAGPAETVVGMEHGKAVPGTAERDSGGER